jgi:hypothetical protein
MSTTEPTTPPPTAPAPRRKRGKSLSAIHPLDFVPFVVMRTDGTGRDFWVPRSSGNYTYDCWLGSQYAKAVLPLLREPSGHMILNSIVVDMVMHGDKSDHGTIVGFVGTIGRLLERPPQLSLVPRTPEGGA